MTDIVASGGRKEVRGMVVGWVRRWEPACWRRKVGAGRERRREIRWRRVERVVLEGRVKGMAVRRLG